MDRYQKVGKSKADSPIYENEVRITCHGIIPHCVAYATSLLQELHGNQIVLKAMGHAISKAVTIAEIIKRVPGLHQDTNISSISVTEVWEPIEEGLLPVEQTRLVSMISITLSAKELNKSPHGYQAPAHDQQIRPQKRYQSQQLPPRQAQGFYNDGGFEGSHGRGWGRGGQGRGTNWSQDGYVTYDNYQDYGGYTQYVRGGGRSGWGYGYPGAAYGGSRGGRGSRGYGRGRQLMGQPRSRGVATQS